MQQQQQCSPAMYPSSIAVAINYNGDHIAITLPNTEEEEQQLLLSKWRVQLASAVATSVQALFVSLFCLFVWLLPLLAGVLAL